MRSELRNNDQYLMMCFEDNQGGFPDLEIKKYTSTLPRSTTGGGRGLSTLKKQAELVNAEFGRINTEDGAHVMLGFSITHNGDGTYHHI